MQHEYDTPAFEEGTTAEDRSGRDRKRIRRDASNDGPQPEPVGEVGSPPMDLEVAQLQSVELLDGDAELASDGVQYVNLPRDPAWVEDPVPSVDRLGRGLRVRVVFDRPGVHPFRARLAADGGNAAYAESERAHAPFTWDPNEHPLETGDDGTVVLDGMFVLPVAGGNTFRIEARDDHGTVRQSHRVTTRRLVYCQELVSEGVQAAPSIDGTVAQLDRAGITLVRFERGTLPARVNVDTGNPQQRSAFLQELALAFASSPGAAKAPHVVCVAYLDRVTLQQKIKLTVPDVVTGTDRTVDVVHRSETRYLWKGIDDTPWLTAAHFTPEGGQPQDIRARCSAIANDHHYPDQCRRVKLALADMPAARGKVELYLLVVKTLGGVSFGDVTRRICVATRTGWVDVPPAKQQALVLHEIGHKLGLVPDGSGPLARSALQYAHTHTGSHCHFGLPSADAYDQYQTGRCVMFGEALAPNQTFCDDCVAAARKADLSAGWIPGDD